MKHYLIVSTESGRAISTVHFDSSHLPGDVSLCGHDLMGDSWLGWEAATLTDRRVNCKDCIRIVDYVRKIKLSEIKK